MERRMALIYRIFSRAWAYVTGRGTLVLLCAGRLPDVGIIRYSAATGTALCGLESN